MIKCSSIWKRDARNEHIERSSDHYSFRLYIFSQNFFFTVRTPYVTKNGNDTKESFSVINKDSVVSMHSGVHSMYRCRGLASCYDLKFSRA